MNTSIRDNGANTLKFFLKNEQNINTLEKHINLKCSDSIDRYNLIIYQVVNDIKNGMKLNQILSNIKNDKILWNHTSLSEYIYEELEQDNFIIHPFEVQEGVLECKCGSKRVYSYSKQQRSCDESTSTHAECMQCKKKWVYSG